MNLQLSLKTKWFEMTKKGIKTEDYREINNYWAKRLLLIKFTGSEGEKVTDSELYSVITQNLDILQLHVNGFNEFQFNIMTLSYPKSTDSERILKLEHKGIEIRTGNPDWGAEQGKLYFVIKHGNFKN